MVDNQIILELKAISALNSAHEAQAHHYLAATGLRLALLLNFGASSLERKRIVRQRLATDYTDFLPRITQITRIFLFVS